MVLFLKRFTRRSSFCVRYRFYLSLSYNLFYLRKSLSQLVYVLSQLVSYFLLSQKAFISACLCFISTCLNALSHTFISHYTFISQFYLTPHFYLTQSISHKPLSQKVFISQTFISEQTFISPARSSWVPETEISDIKKSAGVFGVFAANFHRISIVFLYQDRHKLLFKKIISRIDHEKNCL